MNLKQCRYNPNHKVKPSRIDIHEQGCPDRVKYENKFQLCLYNPSHKIEKELFNEHLKVCENRPKLTPIKKNQKEKYELTFEEEEEIKRKEKLNEIATEQEQIKYERMKYYKGCVQMNEIVGINKKTMKKNEDKQKKILKNKFKEINEYDGERMKYMIDKCENNEDENHEINDFDYELGFDIEKNDKNENEEKFYRYNPNDEDKDIDKYSANRIEPKKIKQILKIENENE